MINFLSRRKKRKGPKLLLLIFVLVALIFFYYNYSLNTPISSDQAVQSFVVESGWGGTEISEQLEQSGLIRNRYVFQLHVWRRGTDSKLQVGEYFLSKSLTTQEIARILSRGTGETKEITLTFIEGWNNHDLASYLELKGVAGQDDFFDVIHKKADWWDEYEILNSKPRNLDLEGYLFPDTYRVFRAASIIDIVRKMLDNLDARLTSQMRQDIAKQGKTIHEILTLASIIEKEVPGDYDRKMVADIFYKRLNAGIALQSDATVNYATGKSTPRASASDLQVESLYNTYKHRGLPPGPIANPSLSAINAAIYPEPNQYWYFLTTPGGDAIYNVSFEDHVADKNKYN